MKEHYKIVFEYKEGEKFQLETAWATKEGKHYVLDNILFYALGYSLGDTVSVEERGAELYVTGLIKESGHSTIRILFNDEKDISITREYLKHHGCASEISNLPNLISVDIPTEVNYGETVKKYLDEGEKNEKWGYEESCLAHSY